MSEVLTGADIKFWRFNNKVKQQDLANMLNISRMKLSRLENKDNLATALTYSEYVVINNIIRGLKHDD